MKRGKVQEYRQWMLKRLGCPGHGGKAGVARAERAEGQGGEAAGSGWARLWALGLWAAVGSWVYLDSGGGLAESDTHTNTFSELSADCWNPTAFWKQLGTSEELRETGSVAHTTRFTGPGDGQ